MICSDDGICKCSVGEWDGRQCSPFLMNEDNRGQIDTYTLDGIIRDVATDGWI
jgi:hypothetical protein